jgi:hypothetical protein
VTLALASLAVTLLGHLFATIWWAATLSSDVRHLAEGFGMLQAAQYTRTDAERDFRNVGTQTDELRRRVGRLEEHVR